MKFNRSAGILLHPTSLPGPHGIGDLGPAAYRWVDFLARCGCKLWQVLPLGPTGYGDSPYQCFSAFAGSPYLISLEMMLSEGLLQEDDLGDMPAADPRRVEYGVLIPWKLTVLERAFQRFFPAPAERQAGFDRFCAESSAWLDDYALFMAIKEAHGGGAWDGWPADLRQREPAALEEFCSRNGPAIQRYRFYQYLFFRQWNALHEYAHRKGVQIVGDIPIFVAIDSADVWSHPDLFFLDEASRPTVVAGVPPDYFSPTGQRWGNPLYRWEVHKREGYHWWIERIRATLAMVDFVRIDHFRGFAGYWEIPADSPTAEKGQWVPGPGPDLFEAIQSALGSLPIIAEDLGVITPDVVALRDRFEFPGMKILQFAFSGPENPFLPHRYPVHCVVYTGTHDNDTTLGWFNSAPKQEREFGERYLGIPPAGEGSTFVETMIRAVWSSVAVFALAPMQDLLCLGTEARMNYPSKLGGNWEWRMIIEDLSMELEERLKALNWLYER